MIFVSSTLSIYNFRDILYIYIYYIYPELRIKDYYSEIEKRVKSL